MENKKLVDINGLSRYHENLKNVFNTKQDVIEDLDAIRSGANAGAAALDAAKEYADGLASNYDVAGAAATAEQNAKDYADGKFQVAGNYEVAGAAAQALVDAKADAESKYQVKGDYEAAGTAAEALEAAKTYVDGKVDGKFDAAGAAATAEQNAKDYADGKFQVAGDYEAAGTAAGLNAAMDERVKALEAIDHEKLATDASAAAVATVLDGAPEKFDTLKEVAEWIAASDSASSAADLVTRVTALEAIDHDAYVEADKTVLASAKEYADGLASNYDAAGAAATAEQNAKDYADGKFQVAGDYEAAGAAAQALVDAKAYVDGKGYATTAQVDAKQDAISDLADIRSGAALGATALQAVPEEYVTEDELTGKGYLTANDLVFADDADIDGLFA